MQLLLRITAVPGHTDALLQALRSVMRSVHVDAGCAEAHLLADVDDRNVLWYWEDWSGLDAFERHLRSERFARLLSVIETSSTLPLLECRLVTETRGLDYLARVRGVEVSGRGRRGAGLTSTRRGQGQRHAEHHPSLHRDARRARPGR